MPKPIEPQALDPVTLAVLKGRLEQIADEMDATLYRSAFNPIIAEAHDACHGLYDAETGDTLIQGKSGLPVFVGAMSFAVRVAARTASERGGMVEGDTWLFNDPYEGGTHANDFKLVRPFFRNGQLFCYLASAAHWHDVGGAVPGNYNPAAHECWQEAVQIPPVRIVREGELDQDVLAILRANTRLPDSLWGDLNGQLAALELGVKRLHGLLDEYGDQKVLQAMQELRKRALVLMRAHISNLPDGVYQFEDVLDNDGIKNDFLTIALDMKIAGDRMTLDFSRSSPQCAGPVNISRATAVAACYVALKHVFPDVPANAGVLDAVDFVMPDRLVITAERPRPVGGYTETIFGRRRYLPDLNQDNRVRRENAERAALNAPMQGSAADIIKIAMLSVQAKIEAAKLKSRLLLQVHDELIFECMESEFEQMREIVKAAMSGAAKLSIPLDVNIGIGRTWDEAAH